MNTFTYRYAFEIAKAAGIVIAAMWSVSFLLFMWSMHLPLLLVISLLVGMYSLTVLVRGMRVERSRVQMRWYQVMWMILMTYVMASLITTAVQGLYLRLVDGGQILNIIQQTISTPEFRKMLQQMAAHPDEVMQVYENLDLRTLTMGMLHLNLELSALLTMPTLLMAMMAKPINHNPEDYNEK